MTFLLIPLSIMLGSALGITMIIWRKWPYLKKLDQAESVTKTSLGGFLKSEFVASMQALKLKEHKERFLAESEKVLRRLRVVLLKIENSVSHLLEQFQAAKRNQSNGKQEELPASPTIFPEQSSVFTPSSELRGLDWKIQEQQLILQIAQNPKEIKLFKKLALLYMKTKQWQDASDALNEALKREPNDLEAQAMLEKVAEKLEK